MFRNHVLENVPEIITSEWGPRINPITGAVNSRHYGIDLVGSGHSICSILSYEAGRVCYIGYSGTQGNFIRIQHNNYKTEYLHLVDGNFMGLKVGSSVLRGEIIGFMGSTGNSTGAHLHFGVLEPFPAGDACVDPRPYLEGAKGIIYIESTPIVEPVAPTTNTVSAQGYGNTNELGTGNYTALNYTGKTMYIKKYVAGFPYPYGLSTSENGAIVGFWQANLVEPVDEVIETVPVVLKPVCPYIEPTSLVKKGSRGDGAKWVQWMLVANGYDLSDYGGVDGDFGAGSDKVVRQYQSDKGLTVDGLVGMITRAALIKGVA